MTTHRKLRLGIVGVGVAGAANLPIIAATPQVELVAVADTNRRVLDTFRTRYGARTYDSIEQLCADTEVEAIWIATPNRFHAPHAIMAAEHGKHAVVAKPMALSLAEAELMIDTAERNNVKLVCGLSVSSMPPIRAMREVIDSGELGAVKALNVWAYTDWMLRPRLPEEVDMALGGGIVFRQGPHQIDTLRYLANDNVRSIRAMTGQWMEGRSAAPGYYTAVLEFESGIPASISYNGYGYFMMSDLITWPYAGGRNTADDRKRARREIRSGQQDMAAAKESWRMGGEREFTAPPEAASPQPEHPKFIGDLGLLIVSCERGDIRQSPNGLFIHDDNGIREVPVLDDSDNRAIELEELYDAVMFGKPVYHDGQWGLSTLEVCLGMLESAQEHREVQMVHQTRALSH